MTERAQISRTELLCTLGPSSFDTQVIRRLADLGVNLFRLNLSHTSLADLPRLVDLIRSCADVPVCLDTEGAQIRTSNFAVDSITVRDHSIIHAPRRQVPGDSHNFNFHPRDIVDQFRDGDLISIDFNSVLVQVIGHDQDGVLMRAINGGVIGKNKAVAVNRLISLAPMTSKDLEAIEIGLKMGLRHFALSFANSRKDVEAMRALVGPDAVVIAKIESQSGLAHLAEIAQAANALLIDRGDLSRDVPLERLPQIQKAIVRVGNENGRKVYVATNFLESMVLQPSPTRAEVNDIYNTLLDGAAGLVLAAETAIGKYPVACAAMVVKMIREFERGHETDLVRLSSDPISLLVPPHGGVLMERHLSDGDRADLSKLPRLEVSDTALLDCQQLALGTYAPLTGFMDRATVDSVLANHRLPNGTVWTLPILLPVARERSAKIGRGERLALTGSNGTCYAVLDVHEVFTLDLDKLAKAWFGTTSADHPGVARLHSQGGSFVAGDVSLVERLPFSSSNYELTPVQSRFIFAQRGWSRVVGFHTRNPIHRGHEFIQLQALKDTGCDGLYINPVIGPKKTGDFLPEPIMRSYQAMLDFGIYPAGKVVLGSFFTYSRYAGPREAVFTALCRKNMGCSHFIIGRDHTGVGDFYDVDANRTLFDALGDIGVTPLFFDSVGFDPRNASYASLAQSKDVLPISGTRVREALQKGERLPEWMMRDIVQDALLSHASEMGQMFVE